MFINLTLSPATSVPDYIVVAIFAEDAKNVLVAKKPFPAPHTAPQNVTFGPGDGVQPKAYIVNTYRSPDGNVLGSLLHSFMYQPTFQAAKLRLTEFLSLSTTSAGVTGGNTYTNPEWADWSIESIERGGLGTQPPGTTISDYRVTGTTSFSLTVTGDVFGDGEGSSENFIVRFYPQIVTYTPTIEAATVIYAEKVIDVDTQIVEADAGYNILLQGQSAPMFTVTLPQLGTIGTFKTFTFMSEGGSHVNVAIAAYAGDIIPYAKKNYSRIILGQGEILQLFNTPTGWRVLQVSPGVLEVGTFIDRYRLNDLRNAVQCDGSILLRTVYVRLWEEVLNSPNILISQTSWNSTTENHAFFHTGDLITTFGLPKLDDVPYFKVVPGTSAGRKAGSFGKAGIGPHKHPTPLEGGEGSGPAIYGPHFTPGGVVRRGDGMINAPYVDVTGDAYVLSGSVWVSAGAETEPKNAGVYKLIKS